MSTATARKRTRLLSWFVLGVVVVVTLVVLAVQSQPSSSPAARADRLARQLRCPTCESQSVADSEATASRAIRADIKRWIAQGLTDDQIRAEVAHSYTEWVLLTPPNNGLGLLVWGLPIGAMLVGAVGLGIWLIRGRREPHLEPTAADEELVARVRGAS